MQLHGDHDMHRSLYQVVLQDWLYLMGLALCHTPATTQAAMLDTVSSI